MPLPNLMSLSLSLWFSLPSIISISICKTKAAWKSPLSASFGWKRFHLPVKSHRACFYSRQSRFKRATRSVATFVRSHRSLRSLAPQRSASLRSLRSLAPFTGSLTHFAPSLVGRLLFMNLCSRWNRFSRAQSIFLSLVETDPSKREDQPDTIGRPERNHYFFFFFSYVLLWQLLRVWPAISSVLLLFSP